ncbi:MAG: YraN family protein [Oligoflexales bacterium]
MQWRARYGEEFVCRFLTNAGWTILARNYRGIGFEVDVIAQKGQVVIGCEVKTRSQFFYTNEFIISARQIRRIAKGLLTFCQKFNLETQTLRIDGFFVEKKSQKTKPRFSWLKNIGDNLCFDLDLLG